MTFKAHKTSSGIQIPAFLNPPVTAQGVDAPADPGKFPYTRGIHPDMYRGKLWTMRQYAGFGTSKETNKRFRHLLGHGQTGLSVAFDLATQMGYDSDHPMAKGEVGRTGVAIDSLEDMEVLFEGLPLEKISTSMTINATAVILLCMYVAIGKKRGIRLNQLAGTVQNDILKEYIARGTYMLPPNPSLRLIADTFEFVSDECQKFNPISISGYHIREAGSTAAQEVAFTFSNALTYIDVAIARGLTIDRFAPRLSFFFASFSDLFEEVAKFRAARCVWAKLITEKYKPNDVKSVQLRFHTQTGGSTLTAQQPENNLMRTTVQALAAVLGGTQSLHTNGFDEALGLPTERAATLALRTQQIIAFETGVPNSADPLGGSYLVEYLTRELTKEIFDIMKQIESRGGSVACIENGYFRDEIAKAAYDHQRHVETGESVVVGVNKFVENETAVLQVLKVNPELERQQKEAVQRVRIQRDGKKVIAAMKSLENALNTEENLVPFVLEAVEAYCTVGEISALFRSKWGEYREQI